MVKDTPMEAAAGVYTALQAAENHKGQGRGQSQKKISI